MMLLVIAFVLVLYHGFLSLGLLVGFLTYDHLADRLKALGYLLLQVFSLWFIFKGSGAL
jgi:hypothetical protein